MGTKEELMFLLKSYKFSTHLRLFQRTQVLRSSSLATGLTAFASCSQRGVAQAIVTWLVSSERAFLSMRGGGGGKFLISVIGEWVGLLGKGLECRRHPYIWLTWKAR